MFTDSRRVGTSGDPEDPGSVLASLVETTGNTVATFNNNHSAGGDHVIDGYVGGMPLLTPEGVPITFGTPFVLKTMIELITIGGTYTDGNDTNMNWPQIAMGLGENATDFDADDNMHFMVGARLRARSSVGGGETIDEDAYVTYGRLATGGSGQITSQHTTAMDDMKLYVTDFMVGADLDANGNVVRVTQTYSASGDDYANSPIAMTFNSLTANQGTASAGDQVYLYAGFQDKSTSLNGSNAGSIVTVRFWYMVEADIARGWGGSGIA